MDKRKVWHGDTFVKLIFMTKQRNTKFVKIFHRQNKPVYSKFFRLLKFLATIK